MKFLLVAVNAKYIHSNLALYDLRAYAREHAKEYAEDILLQEYTINQPKDAILKGIYQQRPEAVFFSCYIWNIAYIREIINDLHKILPELPIYLGGPEVSFDAAAVLEEYPFLAGIMVGEGERSFLSILEKFPQPPASRIIQSEGCMDLSDVPFPYYDIPMEELEHRIIYYESSRGCPFSCSYCLSSVDKRLRFRDINLVKKELQFFIDHKVPQVKFVDRTFNCKHDHAMAIWQYITEHDQGVTNFHFEIAADLLREEEITLMKNMRPGLIQLEIGVQSTNPKTLEAIRRTMDFAQVTDMVKQIQAGRNIHQHLDLIAGLPYEDYASFRHSFNEVYALHPDQLQLGFLKVLKGSYMHEQVQEYGCIYHSRAPYEVLYTKWLSYGDVTRLKSVDKMVDIYYNSGQFTQTIPYLETAFEVPFDLYQALGDFYESKGYDIISHSRIRRYEILLEFAADYPVLDLDKLKETMTYDLYLREKLKSPPTWAADLSHRVIFDYVNRDPLTHNAGVTDVSDMK